jgi:uncharacterized protein (TIGR02001 family)
MTRRFGNSGTPPTHALTAICVTAALLHAAGAAAQDSRFSTSSVAFGGSLSLTSDYVYRGLSQTEGQPALQGGVHVRTESGWSAGLWASTVNRGPGPGAHSEIDLQLSKAFSLGQDWNLVLNANHYFYPNDNRAQPYEYDEVVASLSYQNRVTATASWSPNTSRFSRGVFAEDRNARSYELTAQQPLSGNWSLYGGAGYYDLTELFDTGYWYWNAGVTYNVGNLQMDLSHIDTDHTAKRLFDYEVSERQWIAALSWHF